MAIEVDGVVKVFANRIRALDRLSLAVETGTIYGLLGPNGAGKTTLIRLLATLLPPDAGTATVAGFDIRRDAARVRARIGLAGQYAAVDSFLTGRENVEMVGRLYGLSRAAARTRAMEVLDRIGLVGAADRTVKTYSGGMRRRLDLAASLVGRPRVLFLDEPTAGVDPASRIDVWGLIRDLADTGATILLTTQYLEEADHLADRIAVIAHGQLISEGTADELKSRVGGSMLELRVPEEHKQRAVAALRHLRGRDLTEADRQGRLVIAAPDGAATLMEALRLLDSAAVSPDDVALRRPTLDDVFLSLTRRTATTSEAWAHVSETLTIRQAPGPPSSNSTAPQRSPGRLFTDVAVITRRNLLRNVRLPNLLVLSTILPVVFLVMFTYVFGGAVQGASSPASAGKYINWLLPGLVAQFALFGGGQTAVGLSEDLSSGVIDRFRALPIARAAVLAGRTLSDLTRSALILGLLLAAAFAIGFRWQTSVLGVLAGLALSLVFGYAWSWVMAVVGLTMRTPETIQTAVFMGIFPLAFTSAVFVPTATMPSWLQPFAEHQPVTVVTNALRGLMLGTDALPPGQTLNSQVWLALAWSAGITAVFAPLAVRVYRRTVR
jgi:ABC-2 type transport system ATP-binding protein